MKFIIFYYFVVVVVVQSCKNLPVQEIPLFFRRKINLSLCSICRSLLYRNIFRVILNQSEWLLHLERCSADDKYCLSDYPREVNFLTLFLHLSIYIRIPHAVVFTFLVVMNFFDNQELLKLMTISFILATFIFD